MTELLPGLPPRVFKRLTVDVVFNRITDNRVLVSWAMDRQFIAPGPYTFVLQRGYSPQDENWLDIAQTVDQPWAYDLRPVWPQKGLDLYYRVKLTAGNGDLHISQAVGAGTYWAAYDWTIAREIVRKEYLLQRKRAGTKGWLLRRKLFGDVCPCVDPATDQSGDPNCSICYGTAIVGGYYPAEEYWVLMNPTQRVAKLDADRGLIVDTVETVRGLAYPRPEALDVWVHGHTDQRFLVEGDVSAVARHRGIDLVLSLRLQERGRSEIIYEVPVPC